MRMTLLQFYLLEMVLATTDHLKDILVEGILVILDDLSFRLDAGILLQFLPNHDTMTLRKNLERKEK